jgi:hypothetical protein
MDGQDRRRRCYFRDTNGKVGPSLMLTILLIIVLILLLAGGFGYSRRGRGRL